MGTEHFGILNHQGTQRNLIGYTYKAKMLVIITNIW